jgi:hypothetical protein
MICVAYSGGRSDAVPCFENRKYKVWGKRFMENTIAEKTKNNRNGWLIGGVIAALVYIAATVLFIVAFNQAAGGVYDGVSMTMSTIGAIADTFGTVVIITLIFFIGLLKGKGESSFFVKFFLWAVLITGLYYIMPRFADFYNIVEYNSTITALQTVHILATMVPHMLFVAAILSFILQAELENKKVSYILSWLSFLAAVGMFVVEAVFIGYQISDADRLLNLSYYSMGAFGTFVLIFFSAVLHKACQKEKGVPFAG